MRIRYTHIFILCLCFSLAALLPRSIQILQAQNVDELKSKIDSHTQSIKDLEAEIARYTEELRKTAQQAQSLQTAVSQLTTNSKKLGTELKVTENKIGSTNTTIKQLGLSIAEKEELVHIQRQALAETLRNINRSDSVSIIEMFYNYPNISSFLNELETTQQFQQSAKNKINELRGLRVALIADKNDTEAKKRQLESLKSQLADQQKLIEINKQQQAKLLAETKSKESEYQKVLAEKRARREAFEAELNQYEAQLKIAIDPKSVPAAKKGVLAWPVANPRITQYFGNTTFAQQHAAVYSGHGHNGIDLGMPIGTPIMAALSGTVEGTGDTDLTCPNASYGKWVFIRHDNGLSTLYAHFSLIKATKGQRVNTGDVIGYAGNTGYATGPHLHFTVYASQGVNIVSRPSAACGGKIYVMPVADLKAYLNPMDYLL